MHLFRFLQSTPIQSLPLPVEMQKCVFPLDAPGGCKRTKMLSVPSLNVWLQINIWMVNETIHRITFPNKMPNLENLFPALTQNETVSGCPFTLKRHHSLSALEDQIYLCLTQARISARATAFQPLFYVEEGCTNKPFSWAWATRCKASLY